MSDTMRTTFAVRPLQQRGDGRRLGHRAPARGRAAGRARGSRSSSGIVLFGLFAWLAVANLWMFVFVVGILVSVFLHETGHFVTARMTGMKATQFFLGFGPRLWSFRRGETEYGVRALPLGAFVRIIGMNNLDDVPPEDEARTYRQKSYPAPDARHHGRLADAPADRHRPAVHGVRHPRRAGRACRAPRSPSRTNGPADEAGLQSGDVVLSVDGVDRRRLRRARRGRPVARARRRRADRRRARRRAS